MEAQTSRLSCVVDTSPADWVRDRIGEFGSGVGGVPPHGYGAYARVLHPVEQASPGSPMSQHEQGNQACRNL